MTKLIEPLESFLQRQPVSALTAVLLELAEEHEDVRKRLTRLQLADRPDKLEGAFKKTLAGWRRAKKFHGYRESREFGRELEHWLDQVANELAPKDSSAAVALFEEFIKTDASWFERADDSDGAIGDAVRAACRHWLEAAALCETPAGVWLERLMALADADEYGAREELLRHADLLLGTPALNDMVTVYESRMAEVMRNAEALERPPHAVFKMSAALSLLSKAMRDPDVEVRAVLMYSPEPNSVQREAFAQAYLDADRAEDALVWLTGGDGVSDSVHSRRQSLRAEALQKLGRLEESAPIRQQMFERSLLVFDFHTWLGHLPEVAHVNAKAHAHQLALVHKDPIAAAAMLLDLDDAESAEGRLLDTHASIDGDDYGRLVPLAQALRTHERWRGETVVYRQLTLGILGRANARAYGHAALYWHRLREIADECADLLPLQPHAIFGAEVRSRHARKTAFWATVKGRLGGPSAEVDQIDDSD